MVPQVLHELVVPQLATLLRHAPDQPVQEAGALQLVRGEELLTHLECLTPLPGHRAEVGRHHAVAEPGRRHSSLTTKSPTAS